MGIRDRVLRSADSVASAIATLQLTPQNSDLLPERPNDFVKLSDFEFKPLRSFRSTSVLPGTVNLMPHPLRLFAVAARLVDKSGTLEILRRRHEVVQAGFRTRRPNFTGLCRRAGIPIPLLRTRPLAIAPDFSLRMHPVRIVAIPTHLLTATAGIALSTDRAVAFLGSGRTPFARSFRIAATRARRFPVVGKGLGQGEAGTNREQDGKRRNEAPSW